MNDRLELNHEISNSLFLPFEKLLVSGCHGVNFRLHHRSIRVSCWDLCLIDIDWGIGTSELESLHGKQLFHVFICGGCK